MVATTGIAVRVWDLPTRVFHIALLLCVAGLLITGHVGGGWMSWHFRLGYAVLALLLFRVLWGLVGGRWSRFAHFVPSPSKLLRYLKGQHTPAERLEVGHNPLGALSVLGMIAVLGAQVAGGLVADDEIANVGPLNRFVSSETAALATSLHKDWGHWIVSALIVLHVGAIVFYRVRKRLDLVSPMLNGDKVLEPGTPASRDDGSSRLLALVLWLLCVAAAVGVARLAP
jgi:cytochrome b